MFNALTKLLAKNKRIIKVILPLLITGLIYLSVFHLYLPKYQELKSSVEQLQQEVIGLEHAASTIDDIEEEYKRYQFLLNERLQPFNWDVAKGEPMVMLGAEIHALGVSLTSISQGESTFHDELVETPYNATLSGTFHNMVNYLTYLDWQKNSFYIKDFKMDFPQNINGVLDVSLELVALGAKNYQGSKLDFSALPVGRDNIFDPTIIIPEQSSSSVDSTHGNESGLDGLNGRIVLPPRYDFPTENELKVPIIP